MFHFFKYDYQILANKEDDHLNHMNKGRQS